MPPQEASCMHSMFEEGTLVAQAPSGAISALLNAATEKHEGGIKDDISASKGDTVTRTRPKRCVSMLEMNEIAEIADFGAAMDQLTKDLETEPDTHLYNLMTSTDDVSNASSDDFLFFDEPDEEPKEVEVFVETELPKAFGHQPPAFENTPFKGMRRVMSVASLPTQSVQNCVSSMIPAFHTIAEEEDDAEEKDQSAEMDDGDTKEDEMLIARRGSASSSAPRPLTSSMKKDSTNSFDKSTASGSTGMKRNVSFSSLEIRSYSVTLGDHPCSSGPAMTLDWDYDEKETAVVCVEKYEANRVPRRRKSEMHMTFGHRQYILMRESGFTRAEIKIAMVEAQRVQKQRRKTASRLKYAPVEAAFESTKRKLSFFSKGSRKA